MATDKHISAGTALGEGARAFATRKHNGQKGKRPGEAYIDHLEAVVQLLAQHGEERADVLAAGYLHDCLEKTDTDVAQLIREFGEEVAELVYWLTDSEHGEGREKELVSAWLLARAPVRAKRIKLADIIDNADAICQHDPARWPKFRDGKSLILDRMAAVEGECLTRHALFAKARHALAAE